MKKHSCVCKWELAFTGAPAFGYASPTLLHIFNHT